MDLFTMALGLQSPWKVEFVEFRTGVSSAELYVTIGNTAEELVDEETGEKCKIHDRVRRQWHHLNFFEHACYLVCDVPRIKTKDGCVKTVSVPWARPKSGFTLLF